MRFGLIMFLAVFSVSAYASPKTKKDAPPKVSANKKQTNRRRLFASTPAGVDTAAMDTSTSPCEDFYQYACGGWLKNTPLPADKGRLSRSFNGIDDRNLDALHEILENYRSGILIPKTPYAGTLGQFYTSCMDESAATEKAKPSVNQLSNEIDSLLASDKALTPVIESLHLKGVDILVAMGAMADPNDSSQMIAEFEPGEMGLPTKDYYLANTPKMTEIRAQYQAHISRVFQLMGRQTTDANATATAILAFETKLAQGMLSPAERRNADRTNNPAKLAELSKSLPFVNWEHYFNTAGIKLDQKLNFEQPAFFNTLTATLKETSPATLRDFLLLRAVDGHSFALGTQFDKENFSFSSLLSGKKAQEDRWKRCIRVARLELRDAVAEAFVIRNFGPEAKRRMDGMIVALRGAFTNVLQDEVWLDLPGSDGKPDRSVHAIATDKLNSFTPKIGYPEPYLKYEGLTLSKDEFLQNIFTTSTFGVKRDRAKIGKPTDRTEWHMGADVVNAYYSQSQNEIVFPAGILQPPFFDQTATDGFNFGGIGLVIGHEMTHGFDDQGSKYDKNGNLKEWWPQEIRDKFNQKASCVREQFDGYTVLDGVHLKGDLTLGENLADLGGVKISWLAYQNTKKNRSSTPALTNGFSEDQEFFLGFAQAWCTKYADDALRSQVETDPHSPSQFRVNGPLSNTPVFAKTFGCAEGSKMAPAKRCEVW